MKILVIGDSCEDVYIYGECVRLCPAAPVPIFIPQKTVKNGGMAMNVYENIKSIYDYVDIITNEKLIKKTRYVEMKTNQMIIRVDSEKTLLDRIVDLDNIPLNDYDIIIISDYCKGFLEKEDIEYICNSHDTVFVDTKKILGDYCLKAKIIKINELEFNNNIKAHVNMSKFDDNLIVTMGSGGCKYKDNIYPVKEVDIRDLSGAGDTFLCGLVVEYIKSRDIKKSIDFAQECTTIVVQHKGVNKIGEFINEKHISIPTK